LTTTRPRVPPAVKMAALLCVLENREVLPSKWATVKKQSTA
jgi:hypothetical protein